MKIILFFLVTFSGFSQSLHHQMLSSQGTSTTAGGLKISQTIGQQSVIGNYRGTEVMVGQGFQQSRLMKTVKPSVITLTTTTYPNPFIDHINFEFSSVVSGPIKFSLYDFMGRLVAYQEKPATNTILTITELSLAEGQYFVKLSAKNYNYSTNLLKTK
ncbi:MAG: T9SS type A sorting domain-containing protein [Flavobacteriaceae bacterium]|nr:T9SS type A sorting domain-containing protein [Flavobacteriaceae bacterium]